MSSSIEPVLNTLGGKERCEIALLTMMPFSGQDVFVEPEEIDKAMF